MYKRQQLTDANGREPSIDEIAQALDLPPAQITAALDAITAPVSLYEPVYSEGGDALTVMDQAVSYTHLAVFLVGSRRPGGKSKSLRARFLLEKGFGKAKENADGQSLISKSVITLIKDVYKRQELARSGNHFSGFP